MKRVSISSSRRLVPVLDFSWPEWPQVWEDARSRAVTAGLGGLLLRRGTADQWRRIAEEVADLGPGRPILMADLEQGAASQLAGYPWFPGAFTVGATGSPEFARRIAHAIARQAHSLGLDMILAPVADLVYRGASAVIGTRSYGATPSKVGDMVAAFVRGCREGGVMAVAKHFPGHGRCTDDSHRCLPAVPLDASTWDRTDAVPFRKAIEAGVEGVMVGHIWVDGLDGVPSRPASMSPTIMRLLRLDLGFRGLIVTDSMEMAGAWAGSEDPVDDALKAGADLVICSQRRRPGDPLPPARPSEESAEFDPQIPSLAREVAECAVAWVGCTPPAPARRGTIDLAVMPARRGGDWAAPLRRALGIREPLSGGQTFAVAAPQGSSPEDVLKTAGVRTHHAEAVIVVCGALEVAAALAGTVPLLFTGDATAASQLAAARALLGEIPAGGFPDFPTGACHGFATNVGQRRITSRAWEV